MITPKQFRNLHNDKIVKLPRGSSCFVYDFLTQSRPTLKAIFEKNAHTLVSVPVSISLENVGMVPESVFRPI